MVMEARDDYVGGHPGYLQRIELLFGEPTAEFAAYQNDEIDVVAEVTARRVILRPSKMIPS